MRIDRRSWLKFITAGATAAGIDRKALAKEAPELPPVVIENLATPEETVVAQSSWVLDYERFDVVNWALYDTLQLYAGHGFSNGSLFVEPAWTSGKGIAETNMQQSQMLPCPQWFKLERIYFLFDPENDVRDNNTWRRRATWAFYIGQKVYAAQPFLFTACVSDIAAVLHPNRYPNGLVPADALVVDVPNEALTLSRDCQFYSTFQAARGFMPVADFRVMMVLDGVLARPIQ